MNQQAKLRQQILVLDCILTPALRTDITNSLQMDASKAFSNGEELTVVRVIQYMFIKNIFIRFCHKIFGAETSNVSVWEEPGSRLDQVPGSHLDQGQEDELLGLEMRREAR